MSYPLPIEASLLGAAVAIGISGMILRDVVRRFANPISSSVERWHLSAVSFSKLQTLRGDEVSIEKFRTGAVSFLFLSATDKIDPEHSYLMFEGFCNKAVDSGDRACLIFQGTVNELNDAVHRKWMRSDLLEIFVDRDGAVFESFRIRETPLALAFDSTGRLRRKGRVRFSRDEARSVELSRG